MIILQLIKSNIFPVKEILDKICLDLANLDSRDEKLTSGLQILINVR